MATVRAVTRRTIAAVQAAYYLPTAIAPFVSRRVFERITGPKREWWLVLTVGSLVGTVGAALAMAARDEPQPEIVLLGAGSATVLGTIDVIYVLRRRISPVYLLDAAVELPLAAAWLASARPR
jgi:hypothetical protein